MHDEYQTIQENRAAAESYVNRVGNLALAYGSEPILNRREITGDCDWLAFPTPASRDCIFEGTFVLLFRETPKQQAANSIEAVLESNGIDFQYAKAKWDSPGPETSVQSEGRTLPGGTMLSIQTGEEYLKNNRDTKLDINELSSILTVQADAFLFHREAVPGSGPNCGTNGFRCK